MEKKTYRLCPKCSYFCNSNEPDHYCSLCGAELIETCPSCTEQIENPYAKYCKFCGSQYPGKVNPQEQGTPF